MKNSKIEARASELKKMIAADRIDTAYWEEVQKEVENFFNEYGKAAETYIDWGYKEGLFMSLATARMYEYYKKVKD